MVRISFFLSLFVVILFSIRINHSISHIITEKYVLSELGQVDTPGYALDVAVVGDITYVTDMGSPSSEYGGLFIFNTSNPQNIIQIGHFFDGDRAHDLVVKEDIAFVADNTGGLEILNISNVAHPAKIAQFDGTINNICITKNTVYATDWYNGLIIIDVNNLTHPTEIGRWNDIIYPQSVLVLNNLAYVGGTTSFIILNVSNPSNISKIAQYDYKVSKLQIKEDLAYLACTGMWSEPSEGLRIFNISDPLDLIELGSFYDGGFAVDLHVFDNITLVCDVNDGIEVIDVSNPSLPVEITQYYDGGNATNFQIVDDLIYVADGVDGLEILKIEGLPKINSSMSTLDNSITASFSITTSEANDTPSFELIFIFFGVFVILTLRGKKERNDREV